MNMGTPSNALNISATGIVKFDPVNLFTAITVVAHDVLVGASGNGITSVSPSTAGLVLTSNGTSADPSFKAVSGVVVTIQADDSTTATGSTITLSGGTTGLTTTASGSTVDFTGILNLANGGTSANLTASNGGIFYSTATAGAILSGTATAGQLLRSGSSAAPTWTTSTYPSTNAINTLLYASSANVMSALATANNGVLITGTTGIPSILANGTTGQVLTATTGSPPSWVNSATSGTVTSVSGTANQVAVANGTTTPVISLIGPYTPATYTAHGVLIGEGTSSIVALGAGTAGQVLQSGGASADPAYSTATYPATAGTSGNVLVSNGTNFVSSALSTGGFVWNDTTGTSATLAKGNGYAADSASLTTFTLPSVASSTFGDTIKIMGYNSGGWKIVYTTNQQIIGGVSSTTATTGNLASTNRYDQITIRCSPNTNIWIVEQSFGILAYS